MRDNREFEFRHPFQRPHDSSGRVIRIQNLCLIRASRLIIRGLFFSPVTGSDESCP